MKNKSSNYRVKHNTKPKGEDFYYLERRVAFLCIFTWWEIVERDYRGMQDVFHGCLIFSTEEAAECYIKYLCGETVVEQV